MVANFEMNAARAQIQPPGHTPPAAATRPPAAAPPAQAQPPAQPPARNPAEPALSPPPPDRLALIRSRGELAVCIWPDYFAVSYRNPRNSELEGLDIDMARALANRLLVQLRFVETNFAEFMDRLEAGACDIAMMGVGILPARQQRVAFSKPYMTSSIYAVTTRESNRVTRWEDVDTVGTVVAVAAGTLAEPLMRRSLKQAEVMVVRAPRTRESEVQAGRADVFISDFAYTRRMLLMHEWARVIEAPDRFGETLYGYAVPRGDAPWLAEVNSFLTVAKADGTLARAGARHGLGSILVY
ncbi:substrate-binding periplasmic protein [Belnapia rosea]|uniref:Amino acid ABC transporter substrate-binding protein, PAAT family n=1 Tax=Belnapia rosea TaxID=938405 RepID=A0A1G6PEG9_9PROT|nr:ABC transporter substrate-binding protein [Belnapia rosea]SDC78401.1 amino acid ABC transporter substrate-binding protein, PAAT family [Belnapia rosea]